MSHARRLTEPMVAYRIGDPAGEYPIWDDGGSRIDSGRWHEAGATVIYAAVHYSTAMLEKLVSHKGLMPPNQHFISISVPHGISYEIANVDALDGWSKSDGEVARAFGRSWFRKQRSAILLVPSVVARMEKNVLFNTSHSEFAKIKAGLETHIWWDARLFG